MGFSLFVVSRGYSLVSAHRLTVVASPVSEHGALGPWTSVIAARGLNKLQLLSSRSQSSCGAGLHLSMWDLPGSGIEPMSPALAGRFFTTDPPRKPSIAICHTFSCNKGPNSLLAKTRCDFLGALGKFLSFLFLKRSVLKENNLDLLCFFFFSIYLFYWFIWLFWVLIVAHRIFGVSCGV